MLLNSEFTSYRDENSVYMESLGQHFDAYYTDPADCNPDPPYNCPTTQIPSKMTAAVDLFTRVKTLYPITPAKVNSIAARFIRNVADRHFQTSYKSNPQCAHFHFEHELTQHVLVINSLRYGPVGTQALFEIWETVFGGGSITTVINSTVGSLCEFGLYYGTDCQCGLTWVRIIPFHY